MFQRKTKLEKLQEKYESEKVDYKKTQLFYKIKRLTKKTFWNSDVQGTYRKGDR